MKAATIDLSPIGNCAAAALIDRRGAFVWSCAPRFDGPPVFSALLSGAEMDDPALQGLWAIDLEDGVSVEQHYERNTCVLRTVLTASDGGRVEILDFCPRTRLYGRVYRPFAFFRLIKPLAGAPRVRVRLRPVKGWSGDRADTTAGSSHIRYLGDWGALRLTTNLGVSAIQDERWFRLEQPAAMHLGPDEPFPSSVYWDGERMRAETAGYWRDWVRSLTLPLEWQEAVIRAAITLKLSMFEETGAIVAAMTTSIPEAPGSGRNWDYRYCWIRDAYYVVRALNRLGVADMLDNYLGYLRNLLDLTRGGHVQPVFGIGFETALPERIAALPGYRGMGPVRVGNQAFEHDQHDVYGQIVLPLAQSFYDHRLLRMGDAGDFRALEAVGERAFAVYDQPDAGLWEFRTRAAVHTYSAVACWAACDRLAHAAEALALPARRDFWRARANQMHAEIIARAWRPDEKCFASTFEDGGADASLLQLAELGFIAPDDPRFIGTLAHVEAKLRRGSHLLRYAEADDFGMPESAFTICTFWFIQALNACGRTEEARALFEEILARRTQAGLLSEDIAPATGELWGNYPQTYSLVGLIACATELSRPWASVR